MRDPARDVRDVTGDLDDVASQWLSQRHAGLWQRGPKHVRSVQRLCCGSCPNWGGVIVCVVATRGVMTFDLRSSVAPSNELRHVWDQTQMIPIFSRFGYFFSVSFYIFSHTFSP